MSETALKDSTYYMRFIGLTVEQTEALLEFDLPNIIDRPAAENYATLKATFVNAGVPFSPQIILSIARDAEEGNYRVSDDYHAVLALMLDGAKLREFYVQHGCVSQAEALKGFTAEEWRAMGEYRLHRASHSDPQDFDRHLWFALKAFEHARDMKMMRCVLRRFIQRGNVNGTKQALKALKRECRPQERIRLVGAMLRHGWLGEACEYIRAERLTEMYEPFIARAIRSNRPYLEIQKWAQQLGVIITQRQLLELLVHRSSADRVYADEILPLARRLAVNSKKAKSILRGLYLRLRSKYLDERNIKLADFYGLQAGHPLSVEEMHGACRHNSNMSRDHQRLARRIYAEVNGLPEPPMPAKTAQSA